MRSGSVVFPLVLIAVGVVFLLHNILPDLSVLGFVSKYWPLLFVTWGALRIVELVAMYSKGQPLPTYGMSGGAWFLVVFLTFAAGGLMAINRFSENFPFGRLAVRGWERFGEPFDFPVSASVPAGSATRVVVENLRGNARIVAADVSEVKVTGRNTLRSLSEADAKKSNEKIPLEVVAQGTQILVRTNQASLGSDQRVSSELEITVPKSMSVDCRGRYGDFDISGISGSVDVNSDNAGVRLEGIGGGVRIDLRRSDTVRAVGVKGAVEIKGRGQDLELENVEGRVDVAAAYSGDVSFRNIAQPMRYESSNSTITVEKVTGFVRMSRGELVAARLAGPIRISSRTKNVRVSDFAGPLEVDLDRGDIEVYPGKAALSKMDIKTRNGDVELGLPEGAKFDLRAKTDRGDVENDYGSPLRKEASGRGGQLSGSVGQGPAIVIESDRGRLQVRKATAPAAGDWDDRPLEPRPRRGEAPLPPPPPSGMPQPPKPIQQ